MSAGAAEIAFRRALDGAPRPAEPPWLERLRAEARDAFLERGLPTTRLEDWRFTPLAKLDALDFAAQDAASGSAAFAERLGSAHRLVFVNGRFSPERSAIGELPAGCVVAPLAETIAREPERVRRILGACGDPKRRPFEALNTALFRDGAFVSLAPGVRVARPIHLVYVSSGATPAHVRNLVCAAPESGAVIVEQHAGGGSRPALANAVSELALERAAHVEHVLLQELPETSFGFFALLARQEAESRLGLHSVALGAALARVELEARLEGEQAEIYAGGVYLGRGSQHQDHHTTIDHAAPRTTSRELFKGILDGRAHGVFHGRVHVRPDAQRIDAAQTNRALLLSDGAMVDSKPQLEIYADDVRCSHGASVGQLDPEQLFYLRSRGLALDHARALLTFAFASEVLEKLPSSALRESLEETLLAWLPLGAAS